MQLGEGIEGVCVLPGEGSPGSTAAVSGSLAEQLAAAIQGWFPPTAAGSEPYVEERVRSFTIKTIDNAAKRIELTPA